MDGRRVLAVDLGGTNLRVAVVSDGGELTNRQHVATASGDGPDAVIARMGALIGRVAAEGDVPADAPVGVAAPGPLNPRTGVVHFTPNLPHWRDVPLADRLAAMTGRPLRIANDGNCAVLGEIRFGAARGARDIVYLALGTGVGGGVVSGGRLIDGRHGLGAELGHVTISLDGPRCTCGGIGCLEAFAAGWAIGREAQLVAATEDGEAIRRAAGANEIGAGAVAAAAREGDRSALAIVRRAGGALGAAIGAFLNIFNPELVVIGGGVASLGDLLLDPAREAIPSYSFQAQRADFRLVGSALGEDTGLYGAAALALSAAEGEL